MNINVNRSTERARRHLRSLVVLPAVTVMVFVAAGTYAAARQSRRTVWDGIYNEAQATRGKQLSPAIAARATRKACRAPTWRPP